MLEEAELIERIINGNLAAFGQLADRYERLVSVMVSRIVQNEEDAADVCQEVFIKVYKGLPSFKFRSSLGTWIGRIAYSTAVNHWRKYSGEQGRIVDITAVEDNFNSGDDPEDVLLKKDIAAYLHKLIGKLPLAYRTVLTLYHLNEFSYQEIEEISGMPEGTVKNYLFRARKLLKDKLEKNLKNL